MSHFAFVYTTPGNGEPQVYLCDQPNYAKACEDFGNFVEGDYEVHHVMSASTPIEFED